MTTPTIDEFGVHLDEPEHEDASGRMCSYCGNSKAVRFTLTRSKYLGVGPGAKKTTESWGSLDLCEQCWTRHASWHTIRRGWRP
jgi:hypothetical protein